MKESEFIKTMEEEYGLPKMEVIEALARLNDNHGYVIQAALLANFAEMPLGLAVEDVIRAYNL